jgi:hypothetical protein
LAIVDKDPVPGLEARMTRLRPFQEEQLRQVMNAERKRQLRSAFMTATWNKGFGDVSGDRIELLTSVPGVTHSSVSNSPEGRKWVVTKAVDIEGRPVCWCLRVEPRHGKTVKVTLQEGNAFDLDAAYETAMGEVRSSE